jgi:hypothetical protein
MPLTLSRISEPEIAQAELMDIPVLPSRPIAAARTEQRGSADIVDEWGIQSFPASDPPANW